MEIRAWDGADIQGLHDELHFLLKTLIRVDTVGVDQLQYIHRLSRMMLELVADKRITMISHEDATVLGELRPSPYTDFIVTYIRNMVLGYGSLLDPVRKDGGSIVMADHIAKGIVEVTQS